MDCSSVALVTGLVPNGRSPSAFPNRLGDGLVSTGVRTFGFGPTQGTSTSSTGSSDLRVPGRSSRPAAPGRSRGPSIPRTGRRPLGYRGRTWSGRRSTRRDHRRRRRHWTLARPSVSSQPLTIWIRSSGTPGSSAVPLSIRADTAKDGAAAAGRAGRSAPIGTPSR